MTRYLDLSVSSRKTQMASKLHVAWEPSRVYIHMID